MLSIYLHIPFCRRKCAYCDFFSRPVDEGDLVGYAGLLRQQLRLYRDDPRWVGPVDTVFFGGGTPSLMPPQNIEDLLRGIEDQYGFTTRPEISLEANPETVDRKRLAGYRQAGVNRLSFGVQSLDADQLDWLGRGHSTRQARKAITLAREVGFDNVGLDLIFGVPGQDPAFLHRELEEVQRWGVNHLSCYGLTFEEGTPLFQKWQQGAVAPQPEEEVAAQYREIHQGLTAAGWDHYEISNYARPGRTCRHNEAYWQRRPCLGLGAGAHSFTARSWGERWAVPSDLENFADRLQAGEDPQQRIEVFDRRQAMNETCYLALRTRSGIDRAIFRQWFQVDLPAAYPAAPDRLANHLQISPTHWAFTAESWLLYDYLVQEFL